MQLGKEIGCHLSKHHHKEKENSEIEAFIRTTGPQPL